MKQDIAVAIRAFVKAPLFAGMAILTLTLAIGSNTAIFTLLNALLLRDAPVRDPPTLVQVGSRNPQTNLESGLTYSLYSDLAERQQVFSAVLGWTTHAILTVDSGDQAALGAVTAVSGNYYAELGARPSVGRLIAPDDLQEPSENPSMVAVLGHGFWRRVFNSDPGVVGRSIVVEATPFTIIGVAPPEFTGLGLFIEPDVTVPLSAYPKVTNAKTTLRGSASNWVRVTGRLKPGVTLDQARASIELLWVPLKENNVPPSLQGAQRDRFLATALVVRSAAKGLEPGPGIRGKFTQPLIIVWTLTGLILVVACVNLASLLFARGVSRSREISLRLALGAPRWRVMRQVLVEGLLLSACGALAGTFFAFWVSDALATLILKDNSVPATLDVAPDARILAFTALIASVVGVLCSVIPAWRAGHSDPVETLGASSRSATTSRRPTRRLVAVQVGVSLVLLINAALLVRSFQEVLAVPSGLRHENVLVAYTATLSRGVRNVDYDSYYPQVVERLESLPGVERAAVSNFNPAGGWTGNLEHVASTSSAPESSGVASFFMSVSPNLFAALGIPVREGRDFAWADASRARRVAVVSSTLAQRLFPGTTAIGQRVRMGVLPERQDLEIIGVVADSHIYDLKNPNLAALYVPSLQEPSLVGGYCFVIQGRGFAVDDIRRAVASLGFETVSSARSLDYIVDRVLLQDSLTAVVASFFGIVALLLAAVGVYALLSFEVAQRRREIGIRLAVGAEPSRIVRSLVGEGLAVTLWGVGVGTVAAIATTSLTRSLLFGVTRADPVTWIAAPLTLLVVAGLACARPALGAARTDPITVLRVE